MLALVGCLWATPLPAQELGQEGYANSNGVKIHYVTLGKGPLVVMLHGFPDYSYTWRDQMPVLAKHYQVVAALEASELGTALNPATLDEGVIRLGGPRARTITQAVSRAIYEGYRDVVGGIAYRSRLDDQEWCWALWDDTDVIVVDEPLTPLRRHHRQAVQHAATTLEIQLPLNWQ